MSPLRPHDVRSQSFSQVKRGGYDMHEVDAYLTQLASELESVLNRPTPQADPAQALGTEVTNIMRSAQEAAESLKAKSTAEAEQIRKRAADKALELRRKAQEEASEMVTKAQADAKTALDDAQKTADHTLTTVREQADRLRRETEAEATKLRTETEAEVSRPAGRPTPR